MEKREKIIDGVTYVGILVSYGYGAGWSTWNGNNEEMLFDTFLVDACEKSNIDFKAIEEYCEKKYPDAFLGGLCDLELMWVPKGKKFRITEYDGSEGIEFLDYTNWFTA